MRIEDLANRSPRNAEVHQALFEIAMIANDRKLILQAAHRLSELQPLPDKFSNLFHAQMNHFLPALAIQTGNYVLNKWPDFEESAHIATLVRKLETLAREFAAQFDIPEDKCLEILVLHDKVQLAFDEYRLDDVVDLTSRIISMAPRFVPAYNNRSKASFHRGHLKDAIIDVQSSLAMRPDNIHALSDLVHYLVLLGRIHEARDTAQELLKLNVSEPELIAKKTEAFSFLCDDRAVLNIVEEEIRDYRFSTRDGDPFLFHYAAVSAARTGDEEKAREFWNMALGVQPSFRLARVHLEDLNKPPGERNGAYPFEIHSWFSIGEFNNFLEIFSKEGAVRSQGADEKLKSRLEGFIQDHPWFSNLIPVFLERGDPTGRELAVQLAAMIKAPEAMAALRDFAGSPDGPDDVRFKALQILKDAGIIKKGESVTYWSQGTKKKITLSSFRIDSNPSGQFLPEDARPLVSKGMEAFRRGDLYEAERLFEQARMFAPNHPSIEYNSILIDIQRRNISKGRMKLLSLAERHPDYIFAHTELTLIDLANGRLREAIKHIAHLNTMEHFHFDEYAAYMKAQIFLSIIEGQPPEATEKILSILENVGELKDEAKDLRAALGKSLADKSRVESVLSPLKE